MQPNESKFIADLDGPFRIAAGASEQSPTSARESELEIGLSQQASNFVSENSPVSLELEPIRSLVPPQGQPANAGFEFSQTVNSDLVSSMANAFSALQAVKSQGQGLGACGCGVCGFCNGSNGTTSDGTTYDPLAGDSRGGTAFGGGAVTANGVNPRTTDLVVDLDQVVFLDFDSGTDPNPFFNDGPIEYTQAMREDIQAQLNQIFEAFGVTYVTEEPTDGDFSTLLFRTSPRDDFGNPSGATGRAIEGIDHLNQNKNDTVIMNVLIGSGLTTNSPAEAINEVAVNVGAHEIAHALGLRHHDSFGPIGSGVSPFTFFPLFYPGPAEADETPFHVINTPVFGGDSDFFGPRFFGARESVKLTFTALGESVFEEAQVNDSFEQAQAITLNEFVAPNTIEIGEAANAGDFRIEAANVIGSFEFTDPSDFYSFEGSVGRAYSFEVISNIARYEDVGLSVDPTLAIFDSAFQPVDYYGIPAFNDDDLEGSFDSHIFDLFLPEDDIYYVQVDTFGAAESGTYELFISSVDASPFQLPEFDDHADTLDFGAATRLEFTDNSSVEIARATGVIGFVDNPVEQDVFSFTVDEMSRVIINVRADTDFFDSFVQLFDSGNNLIAFNNDTTNPSFETPTDSQFVVSALEAGDYLVVVSAQDGSNGNYRLGVRHNGITGDFDDHGESFVTATNLALAPFPETTHVSASAALPTDSDVFVFTSSETGRLVVRTAALNGDLNTVLRGFDSDRNRVAANNNFNGSKNSRISLEVVSGQTYFVRVTTVRETTGDYRISFRSVPDGGDTTPTPPGATNLAGVDPNINLDWPTNVDSSIQKTAPVGELNFSSVTEYSDFENGILG